MAFRNLLQSSFMQSILSFIPSMRHAIEQAPPSRVEAAPALSPEPTLSPSTSPTIAPAEPWKEEVERLRQVADKTAAERDQLKEEAGRLNGELQQLVADLSQVRVEAEEAWRAQEGTLRREGEEAVRAAEERIQREANEALKAVEERLLRERHLAVHAVEEKLAHEKEEAVRLAEEGVQKAQDEARALATELEENKREQQGLQATLETRQTEIKELKLVVGSDTLGDADVVQLLKNLNEEIAKTAKSARDLFKLDRSTRANGKLALESAAAIEGWVGSALPGLLSTQYRGNPVLLQAAVQALAAAFSSWISSSYSFMHEHDQILDETYKFVMNSENQLVLGRWRALTHKYAKQGMPNLADELTKMFLGDVRNLFVVAGSSTTQTETLIARTRDSLRAIVDAAIRLRTAINEDVISCDYETVLIHPSDMFDPANMEDAFPDAKPSSAPNAKNVLCTAGLGLRCCRKREGNANTQWEVTVLQKPQVILQSAIGQ